MDWKQIKAAYVAGGVSLRELSDKYGVSFSTIQKKSMEEKWGDLRKKRGRKAEEKLIDAVSSKEARRGANIVDVADKLLGKISEMLEMSANSYNTQNIKNLTSALKDLKEIKGFKSEADMREQEARIKNLEKQAMESESGASEIHVTFGDASSEDVKEWVE